MGDVAPVIPYGEKFQFGRKVMNQALSARAVGKWEGVIAEETFAMLRNLSYTPKDFIAHLNRLVFIRGNCHFSIGCLVL